ncbi:putative Inorganic pyrophosphatase [Trypanosoma vivax]|nr:putative Inorganic pyrophosphatase [Trypanosoma vivax]
MMRLTSTIRGTPPVAISLPTWVQQEVGAVGTHSWRMFFSSCEGGTLQRRSAWHDLPLRPSAVDASLITFVCEIPKGTRAKFELSKTEPYNPIMQDVFKKKDGRPLRFFKYGDIPFNYGFAPRTWEDPSLLDDETKCNGDGDPLDVVELSAKQMAVGSIVAVRVLGVLGLIDEEEADWKIVTEAVGPDGCGVYGSLSRVPCDLKSSIVQWFRMYKTADGAKPNEFAYNGEVCGSDEALRVVERTSRQYEGLVADPNPDLGYWLR